MTGLEQPFFLFLGEVDRESARSTLKSSGIPYVKKLLSPRPENWAKIVQILRSPNLLGVLLKLNTPGVERMFSEEYSPHSEELLEQLAKVRHVVFLHENILTGEQAGPEPNEYDEDDELNFLYYRSIFPDLTDESRARLRDLIDQGRLDILIYRTNAELSISATRFLQENDKRLLFRVYLPKDRLWVDEADKLLTLFRDWLSKIKGHRIRQGGYSTAHGEVYEFYATDELSGDAFSAELDEFSSFLDICIEDPSLAASIIENSDLDPAACLRIVDRYAKEARRLRLDIKHARESKLLSIRQRLEVEFEDAEFDPTAITLRDLSSRLSESVSIQNLLGVAAPGPVQDVNVPNVVINQSIINAANGIVAREISGDVFQGREALQISTLIAQYGGANRLSLQSALHELEDEDANSSDRVTARQRIRTFLAKVSEKVSGPTIEVLQKYIETKLGL